MTKLDFLSRLRLQEFVATAERLEEERSAAAVNVPRLLNTHADWTVLAEHPAMLNGGAIEFVGMSANHALNRDPKYALALAELAATLAVSLPEDSYHRVRLAQVRAHAWKDYGKTLRYLARCPEALNALDRAESFLDGFGALAHDRAIVRFNLAVACQEVGRFEESLALLRECKDIFREHLDTPLAVLAAYTEGVCLHRLRKFREARETYLLLLASTDNIQMETLASLHQSIGYCCIELEDFEAAEANLTKGIRMHHDLGQPLQALKGELGLGRLYLRMGDYARVVDHLRPIRREFIRKSLAEEAGLCGLEIVQALLFQQRNAEAENLARKIVHEFTAAELKDRAITALGFLTEATRHPAI